SIYAGLAVAPGFVGASLEPSRADVSNPMLSRLEERPAWRKITARVTPAGIWVPGPKGQEQLIAANAIANMQKEIQENFAAGRTGPIEPFPAWSPRMAIGI